MPAFAPPIVLRTQRAPFSGASRTRLIRRASRACAAPPTRETTREKLARERRALDKIHAPAFATTLYKRLSQPGLTRQSTRTLQINIGLTCDLACRHCHVESSPLRTETMSHDVANRLIDLTSRDDSITAVDITGGAPELHAQFRHLVRSFSAQGLQVTHRSNLVALAGPGQEDTAQFLAGHGARIVASLPCYEPANVEKQRGDGVFDTSIRSLQYLNKLGYGVQGSGLELVLVYNPVGAALPPAQGGLERTYRRELQRAFGIVFSSLVCITNMPIKRFADDLIRAGEMQKYLDLLVASFNPETVPSVMCVDMIHVAWDGTLYDCDFNYALAMSLAVERESGAAFEMPEGLSVFDIDDWACLVGRRIQTDKHCYGCTAGSGSSCGGSLTE